MNKILHFNLKDNLYQFPLKIVNNFLDQVQKSVKYKINFYTKVKL